VTDHRQVLLNLPGWFLVGTAVIGPALLPAIFVDDDVIYVETEPAGITFNYALVNASMAYYNGGDLDELTTES